MINRTTKRQTTENRVIDAQEEEREKRIWKFLLIVFVILFAECAIVLFAGYRADQLFHEKWRNEDDFRGENPPEWADPGLAGEAMLKDEDDNVIVRYQIPEGYELYSDSKSDWYSRVEYNREDYSNHVDIQVFQKGEWTNPQAWVLDNLELFRESSWDVEMQEINGYNVFYGCGNDARISKKGTEITYHFYAATQLQNGCIYTLSATSDYEEAEELNPFLYFLTLQEDR